MSLDEPSSRLGSADANLSGGVTQMHNTSL